MGDDALEDAADDEAALDDAAEVEGVELSAVLPSAACSQSIPATRRNRSGSQQITLPRQPTSGRAAAGVRKPDASRGGLVVAPPMMPATLFTSCRGREGNEISKPSTNEEFLRQSCLRTDHAHLLRDDGNTFAGQQAARQRL